MSVLLTKLFLCLKLDKGGGSLFFAISSLFPPVRLTLQSSYATLAQISKLESDNVGTAGNFLSCLSFTNAVTELPFPVLVSL